MKTNEVKRLIERSCPYTNGGSQYIWHRGVVHGLLNISSPTTNDTEEYKTGWNWGDSNRHLVKDIVINALG